MWKGTYPRGEWNRVARSDTAGTLRFGDCPDGVGERSLWRIALPEEFGIQLGFAVCHSGTSSGLTLRSEKTCGQLVHTASSICPHGRRTTLCQPCSGHSEKPPELSAKCQLVIPIVLLATCRSLPSYHAKKRESRLQPIAGGLLLPAALHSRQHHQGPLSTSRTVIL